MINMAINILWLLIGIVVLCGAIWLVLYGIKNIIGMPVPPKVEQGIWFVVLILIIIAALTLLAGGTLGGWGLHHV